MVDVCLCHNSGLCSKSSSCFRALGQADEYQTVADFYTEDTECSHYWPVKSLTELKQLNEEWK